MNYGDPEEVAASCFPDRLPRLEESLNGRGGDIRLALAQANPKEASTHRTDLGLTAQAA